MSTPKPIKAWCLLNKDGELDPFPLSNLWGDLGPAEVAAGLFKVDILKVRIVPDELALKAEADHGRLRQCAIRLLNALGNPERTQAAARELAEALDWTAETTEDE